MMSSYRRPVALFAGAVVAASALALPAQAVPAQGGTEPTTLAIEGTIKTVVIDNFGPGAHADYLHTVVTDDGAEIPVDLDEQAPANARFRGEVVIAGGVASTLRSKGLLPSAGSTILEDTRAGRVAVAEAEDQTKPLTVASSTIAPAAAAAPTPSAHRAYVAKMTNQGSVEGDDGEIEAKVNDMLDYWEAETNDYVITDFSVVRFVNPSIPGAVPDPVTDFTSTTAGPPSQNCGIRDPEGVWDQAAGLFPGVNFGLPGNHLIVLVGEECVAQENPGPVGVANVGNSINDGGVSIVAYDAHIFKSTGVHEIGHNFGLYHANLNTCPDVDTCEYLDLYSPMGISVSGGVFQPPALGSLYRGQLGLAAPGEIASLALAPGQSSLAQAVTLAPRSTAAGQRGLLVKDPSSGRTYSIDWRSGTARDDGAFYDSPYAFYEPAPLYPTGIVVELQAPPGETYLITHPVGGRARGAFAPGETFAPSSGLSVSVNAIGATATVTVQLTGPTPPPAQPAQPKRFSTKTPKISGTARVGKTLKVKVGSWSPRPSFRYQWYANGKKITSKGTKSSFKLTNKQKGKRITVRVTARKTGYTTVTKASKSTKKVAKK